MGPLALPSAGLVYLDACSLIYSVERVEPYRTLLEPMWQEAQDGNLTIVTSPVLAIEVLVKPIRDGNTEIEMQYRKLFGTNAVRLLEASYPMFEDAARLRAETGLKTPDPLQAATALRADCALFIANDTDFGRVQGLPVVVLDDLLRESSQVQPQNENVIHAERQLQPLLRGISRKVYPQEPTGCDATSRHTVRVPQAERRCGADHVRRFGAEGNLRDRPQRYRRPSNSE